MKINKTENSAKTTVSISRLFFLYLTLSLTVTMAIIAVGTYISIEANYNFTYAHIFIFLPILLVANGVIVYIVFNKFFLYFGMIERNLEKIAKGDYKIKIPKVDAGTFVTMIENFNNMTTELDNRRSLNDDFVNNFSHEFKTPISSIKGFADLLLSDELEDEDRKKYLKIISEESERLASLSEKALFLSKINIQNTISDKIKYSLDSQIIKNLVIMEKNLKEKNITVNSDLDKIDYYSNPDIINHIWINLISNAIKYTNEDGAIYIKLKKIGKNIVFTIQDTGVGIDSEKQKYIFNEYYQVDESHKSKGVGLGLSVVKKVLNLVDGSIEVFSEVNKGTTFVVKLKKS